jgi:2-polyprenyl-6-methoxyphenol hydroxylase-like FAD-dependent oxidoreductase
MKVIVVGGGIGGLSLALSLHQIGFDPHVFESAPAFQFLGLGINVQPHAVRELTELGLGEALARNSIPTAELAYYNKHGQLIWSEPRGLAAGYRWPQHSVSRGELQHLLLEAAQARLGRDRIHSGHHLAGFAARDDGVVARFTDRATGRDVASVEGDILVGADGIHSAVRRAFSPREQIHYEGVINYRGVTAAQPYLTGATMVIAGHRDQRFVAYPIRKLDDGRYLTNWICVTRTTDPMLPLEEWGVRADKAPLLDTYAGWTFPWLDIPALVEATPDVFAFPDVDRDPLPQWSFGRVTIVGDAAHPMLPVGAQAGSQAIVDGRVLAAALLRFADPAEALRTYQRERMEAMNGMILRNRRLGPETVMQWAEERAPDGFSDISAVLSADELTEASISFKRAAGFDVETVNTRASYLPPPTAPGGEPATTKSPIT